MGYCLVVDMNKYAGDFERELCAYLTGHVNPGTVLLDEAEMYLKKHPLNEKVVPNGNNRVVELSRTTSKWDNGSGFTYRTGQEAEALKHYQTYMEEYKEKAIKVLNRDRVFMGEEAYQDEIESLNLQYQDAMNLTEPIQSKVKHSVVIYFKELINEEEFAFFLSRVDDFCTYYDEGIAVEAVHFVREDTGTPLLQATMI